jgi:two-component system, NarL family, sensor kinase
VQESLTNIHRHSGSKSAAIRMSVDPDKISLEVQDHGKGSMNAINGDRSGPFRAGVGITGMQERVRELGGTLEITADQKGTHVKVVVPLAAESCKAKGYDKALSAVG